MTVRTDNHTGAWLADTWLGVAQHVADDIRTGRVQASARGGNPSWQDHTGICRDNGSFRVSAYTRESAAAIRVLLGEPTTVAFKPAAVSA